MTKLQAYGFGLSAALAVGLAALTFGPAHAQQPAGANRFEGTLSIVWGDPRPGQPGGATRFSLTLGAVSAAFPTFSSEPVALLRRYTQ